MHRLTILLTIVATMSMAATAAAAAGLTTCSGNRDYCVAIVKSRGNDDSTCQRAFRLCIQTGVWDSMAIGSAGRRVSGVGRR
jgi:hypothetical protein